MHFQTMAAILFRPQYAKRIVFICSFVITMGSPVSIYRSNTTRYFYLLIDADKDAELVQIISYQPVAPFTNMV